MISRIAYALAFLTLTVSVAAADPPLNPQDWKLGIKITENTIAGQKTGVKILEVFPDSPAERIGLQPGDIVQSVDGVLFNDPLALRADIMGKYRKEIAIIYERGADFHQQRVALKNVVVTVAVTDLPQAENASGILDVPVKVYIPGDLEKIGEPKKVADPRLGSGPKK